MSIESATPRPSRAGTPPGVPDPRQMTEVEKCMAEWEARHDVAARGHRAGADAVQHYLGHERLTHPAAPLSAVPPSAASSDRSVQEVAAQPGSDESLPHHSPLLDRLLHRRH